MTHATPFAETPVTLGHLCDSRASRVPTPTPTPTKNVQPAEGGALRESPRGAGAATGACGKPVDGSRGAGQEHRPAAGRDEHRASRRGPSPHREIEPTELFRLLCALIGAELRAHPDLNFTTGYVDLVEHMKCAAAHARLPYGQDPLRRALDAVEHARRARTPKPRPEAPRVHWRDRCAHTPTCATPTQCDLRAAKEGRR
jgi:hypothetical protein